MKKLVFLILLLCLLLAGRVTPAAAALPTLNTWYATSTGMVVPVNVETFAFSPNYTTDHVVYAGTYNGVYRSSDAGFNWTLIGTGGTVANIHINSLAVSSNYATDKALVAGGGNGVLLMPNADTATNTSDWTDITGDLGTVGSASVLILGLSPDYANDHTLFAGTFSAGLFKTNSVNGAATAWSDANSGIRQNSRITSLVFAPNYAGNQTLFVGADSSDTYGGVYRSTNRGSSWTEVVSGILPDDPTHRNVTALAISPNYSADNTLFAGLAPSQGVFKSTNSGDTWSFLAATQYMDGQALAISPDYARDSTVFVGGSGVSVSTNGGASWVAMNSGFDGTKSVIELAIPPGQSRQPFNLFAGTFSDQVWQMLYQGASRVFLPLVRR